MLEAFGKPDMAGLPPDVEVVVEGVVGAAGVLDVEVCGAVDVADDEPVETAGPEDTEADVAVEVDVVVEVDVMADELDDVADAAALVTIGAGSVVAMPADPVGTDVGVVGPCVSLDVALGADRLRHHARVLDHADPLVVEEALGFCDDE